MHLLLQQDLNRNEINAAEVMLKDFCAPCQNSYGEMNCTINAYLFVYEVHYGHILHLDLGTPKMVLLRINHIRLYIMSSKHFHLGITSLDNVKMT